MKAGASRLALHLHLASVIVHDLSDDGEPESCSTGLAMRREGLEEPATDLLGDSWAVVREGHQDRPILLASLYPHHEETWLPLERLHGIARQVMDGSLDPVLVEVRDPAIFQFELHLHISRTQIL